MAQLCTIFFAISFIYSVSTDSYLTLNFSNYVQTIEEVVHRSRLPLSDRDIPRAFNTVKEIAEIVAAIEDHYSIIKSEIILPGQYDTIDSHFREFMERLQTFLSYLIIIPKEITDNLGEKLVQKDLDILKYIRNHTQDHHSVQYVRKLKHIPNGTCELEFHFIKLNFYLFYQTILSELKVYLMNMFIYLQYQYHVNALKHFEDVNIDMDVEYIMQSNDAKEYVGKHEAALVHSYKPGGIYDCTPREPIKNVETLVIDDSEAINALDLKSQISDIQKNMVVTNIKFVNVDGTIYIQIQQASLSELQNGSDGSSENWKPISKNSFDRVPLDLSTKSFNLDDIFVPAGYVITGIRFDYDFNSQDSTSNKLVSFEINVRATPYDFVNNKLITLQDGVPTSIWVTPQMSAKSTSSSFYKRQRTLLHPYFANNNEKSREMPQHIQDSVPNQFLYLRSSGIINEKVPSIIPHFDLRPPYSKWPFPLNGVGICVKGYNGSIGYLTLKTFPHSTPPMY